MSYLQVDADISSNVRLFGSFVLLPTNNWIDEAYLEVDKGTDVFRLGRFRSAFGFSDWSELYYTPFIGVPMIRSYGTSVVSGVSLDRRDRGVSAEGGGPNIQYEVALVDSKDDNFQVKPATIDSGIARLQLSQSSLMIGLNGFAKAASNEGPAEQISGIDLRWTASHLQIRGELIKGLGTKGETGYYADIIYRPPGFERTQLGARVQAIDAQAPNSYVATTWGAGSWAKTWWGWQPAWPPTPTKSKGALYTLALRQFLNQNFTLSVNYGTGTNIPEARGLRGWSLQLLSSFRF